MEQDQADTGHLKRLACQVFTQLPEDKRDALQVLRLVRQLVFCLGEDWEAVTRSASILPFERGQKDRAAGPRAFRGGPLDLPDIANQE